MAGSPVDAVRLFEASGQIQELDRSDKAFFFGLALHASGQIERGQVELQGFLEGQLDPAESLDPQVETLGDARQARLLGLAACVLSRPALAVDLFEHGERIDRLHLTSTEDAALEALTRGSLAATLMVQGSRRGARRERSLALELAPTADLERRIRIGVAQSRRLLRLSGCTSSSG